MGEYVTYDDIMKALDMMRTNDVPDVRRTYFVGGTGIPDQTAIEYFKGTGIRVLTTDGRVILDGQQIDE